MNMLIGALASAFFGVAFTALKGVDLAALALSSAFLVWLKSRLW